MAGSWPGRRNRDLDHGIDVERQSPSCSPRKGNDASSSSAFAADAADADAAENSNDAVRPESASLLPHPRRPPTFDGVTVAAIPSSSAEATPSKRYRRKGNDGGGGGGAGGGGGGNGGRRSAKKPAWADSALHLTTAVIGVGILGLPRALVDLGWPLGILAMVIATSVTLYTALLLVEMCSEGGGGGGSSSSSSSSRHPPPPTPTLPPSNLSSSSSTPATAVPASRPPPPPPSSSQENAMKTYGAVARATLGPALGDAVSALQLVACCGLAVTYCVTGGASLASLFPGRGTEAAWSLAFGLSQLPVAVAAPDLERLAGVSAGGAAASALYAGAAVLASARASLSAVGAGGASPSTPGGSSGGGGEASGGAGARGGSLWSALDAVSTILFAFGGHFVLPEIAAASSSPSPPPPSQSHPPPSPMASAVKASYVAVALSYFSVAVSGAAAFGRDVADDVLLSAGAGPKPLVTAANAAVCLHVAAGLQVFSQPCYSSVECWFRRRREDRGIAGRRRGKGDRAGGGDERSGTTTTAASTETAVAPPTPSTSLDSTAIAARASYIVAVSAAAAALPFFSVCMALVGALAFAPATFVLPLAYAYAWPSHPSSSHTSSKMKRRKALHGAMALCFGALSLACAVSATRGLVVALERRLRGG